MSSFKYNKYGSSSIEKRIWRSKQRFAINMSGTFKIKNFGNNVKMVSVRKNTLRRGVWPRTQCMSLKG